MTDRATASTANARICPNCNGFATAAVSSAPGRDTYGHLPTTTVDCGTCHGTGTLPLRPRLTATDVEAAA